MAVLWREPQHVDEMVCQSSLAAASVSATLALLELKGLVREMGGMQYGRVREEPAGYAAADSPGAESGSAG